MVDNLYWLFMVIMVLVLGTFLSEPDILGMMKWLFYFACFLLVFDVLYIICAADDYIYISENVGSVYIYKNPSGYYIMEKVLKQEHDFWYINSYEIITSTYKHSALLYELSENKQWYYLTGKSKQPCRLGNKVGNTIFEIPQKGGKKELRVLFEDTYTTFCVDAYNCKNIYVSPFYSDKIMQVNRFDIFGKWLGPTTIPEQYLVIRNNGLYDVFGLYYKQEYGPSWMELAIPVVLLKDGANHVVLKYQQERYQKIYDEQSVVNGVCDKIAQFTDDYRIGGIIWKLNPEKNELEKVYEGNFRGIDFDGCITGDDGQEFLFKA